jgi:hypothetical protein
MCVCAWMLDGVWLVHETIRNRLDPFMKLHKLVKLVSDPLCIIDQIK